MRAVEGRGGGEGRTGCDKRREAGLESWIGGRMMGIESICWWWSIGQCCGEEICAVNSWISAKWRRYLRKSPEGG